METNYCVPSFPVSYFIRIGIIGVCFFYIQPHALIMDT